jgi:hypothetical protein
MTFLTGDDLMNPAVLHKVIGYAVYASDKALLMLSTSFLNMDHKSTGKNGRDLIQILLLG